MTLKSLFLTLLITLSLPYPFPLFAAFNGNQAASAPLDGWRPFENVTAPEVIDAAQFAVAEHNKQTDSMLKFPRVVAGEYQVVDDLNYQLIIAAKNGAVAGKYEAVVYVRPWAHYESLTSFQEVKGSRDTFWRRN